MKVKLMVTAIILLACSLGGSCTPAQDFDKHLNSIVKPYRFNLARWEFSTLSDEVEEWLFGRQEKSGNGTEVVTQYFTLVEQINTLKSAINANNRQDDSTSLEAELDRLEKEKTALGDIVERILEKQIKDTMAEQGIFNPLDKYVRLKASFPPINFELEKPPCLLVISPRERIDSIKEITLQPRLSLEKMEGIEANADKLGVSSLVVKLGGMAAYPSFVTDDSDLRFTIDTATEEWLHQYLSFQPLGFLYLLDATGIYRNYEIVTINETVAGMVSKEIGAVLYETHYSGHETGNTKDQVSKSGFDFNREMREIRKTVDRYLAQGEIEQAEEFMEQKRQYLATHGYYIRKLNQAYFAFHGTYADSPTSISPIGVELRKLRSQSASLKDFLNAAAGFTGRQGLKDSIKEEVSP